MSRPTLPVLKAVRALLETGTGKPCGLGRIPSTQDGSYALPPYTVLTYVAGVDFGPPLGDDSDTAEVHLQVTAVGGGRQDQALWMRDRAHAVLVGKNPDGTWQRSLTVAGASVLARRMTDDVGVDETDGIVSHVVRYAVTVTGA